MNDEITRLETEEVDTDDIVLADGVVHDVQLDGVSVVDSNGIARLNFTSQAQQAANQVFGG